MKYTPVVLIFLFILWLGDPLGHLNDPFRLLGNAVVALLVAALAVWVARLFRRSR